MKAHYAVENVSLSFQPVLWLSFDLHSGTDWYYPCVECQDDVPPKVILFSVFHL